MTVDGIALGMFVAGGIVEGPGGRDTDASEALMSIGMLGGMFGSPIVHLVRGHGIRAVQSFGLRSLATSVGMAVAVSMRDGCDGFLCEMDYLGYGFIGGLAVAAAIDAAYLTEERVERTTVVPTIAATSDGARVGVAWTW